ncbi:MAG: CpaF family protein [Planctomycetota bacterium]
MNREEERPATGADDGLRDSLRRRTPSPFDRSRRPTGQAVAPAASEPAASSFVQVKAALQRRLFERLARGGAERGGEEGVRTEVEAFVDEVLAEGTLALNASERTRLADELVEEALGVGPLAPLMADPAVTDILVNGPNAVYVERFGRLEPAPVRFRDAEHIRRLIERLAARMGRRIDQGWPMVDLRLPDGSRVNATLPPVSIDSPTLSIRRFGTTRLRAPDLVEREMFSEPMARLFEAAVRARASILVSGGTGAGKSTLLGAIAESIPGDERILTIEDTAELQLDQRHVVRLETRPANVEGQGTVSTRHLVVNALRMRPSRILIGEVRGAEALDMLQAMNTGHEGGLTTIHANSPRDALSRLETMVLMAGLELPSRAIREQIASALQFVVHVRRFEDGVRRVASVAEVTGLEGPTILLQEIFRYESTGHDGRRLRGDFRPTGTVPRFVEQRRRSGEELSSDLFRERRGSNG